MFFTIEFWSNLSHVLCIKSIKHKISKYKNITFFLNETLGVHKEKNVKN